MKKNKDMIFGIRAVIEAIEAGKEINKVIVQSGLQGDLYKELRSALAEKDGLIQTVPVQKLNKISAGNHQGVIAYISPVPYHRTEDIIPGLWESGKTPLLLILDQITDVRNFGAIARTAQCMGVDAIIIPEKGSAQINGDAVKTSAGALLEIPVCREKYLKNTIELLKNSGLSIVGCTEKGDTDVQKADLTGPVAVILGSEEDGISPTYLKLCDVQAHIPMFGKIASLNVSVAAGMLLYELQRQRNPGA